MSIQLIEFCLFCSQSFLHMGLYHAYGCYLKLFFLDSCLNRNKQMKSLPSTIQSCWCISLLVSFVLCLCQEFRPNLLLSTTKLSQYKISKSAPGICDWWIYFKVRSSLPLIPTYCIFSGLFLLQKLYYNLIFILIFSNLVLEMLTLIFVKCKKNGHILAKK